MPILSISPISIHALREEGDGSLKRQPPEESNFYPRPPRGGRPRYSTLSCASSLISIHALREEGDLVLVGSATPLPDFYPRPPRGGRRELLAVEPGLIRWEFLSTPSARRATIASLARNATYEFLSTPSARRATSAPAWRCSPHSHFYPRPPRGGRPCTRAASSTAS